MYDHKHYVPILRWKQGEQLALRELYPRDRSSMTPLVEIPRDYEKDIDKTVNAVAKNWGSSELFVDIAPILSRVGSPWGRNPVTAFFNAARNQGLGLIPVTGLRGSVECLAAVRDVIAKDQRGACVRLFRADLARQTLNTELKSLVSLLGTGRNLIDLVLDLQIFDRADQGFARFCSALPNLTDWRTFTIAAGAFPEDLTGLSVGQHNLPRYDWSSWRGQVCNALPRRPTYGDYATLHPFLKPDMQGLNPSASIRYTSDEHWVVMRGEGLRNKGGPGHVQYPANAELLTLRPEYCGQYFSFGDNYIYEISLNKGKTGNPQTWVTAGVNHHLTFAVRQINDMFSPSTGVST